MIARAYARRKEEIKGTKDEQTVLSRPGFPDLDICSFNQLKDRLRALVAKLVGASTNAMSMALSLTSFKIGGEWGYRGRDVAYRAMWLINFG